MDREELGKLVRKIWITYAQEIGDTKPSHLLAWEDLDESNKEVDMRIGEKVADYVLEHERLLRKLRGACTKAGCFIEFPSEEAVPTVTTLARHALVTHEEQENAHPIAVDDCGFRMLAPKEIQAAMAFPSDYVVTGTRREQVKQLGNACTPPVIELLMRRLIASLQ